MQPKHQGGLLGRSSNFWSWRSCSKKSKHSEISLNELSNHSPCPLFDLLQAAAIINFCKNMQCKARPHHTGLSTLRRVVYTWLSYQKLMNRDVNRRIFFPLQQSPCLFSLSVNIKQCWGWKWYDDADDDIEFSGIAMEFFITLGTFWTCCV